MFRAPSRDVKSCCQEAVQKREDASNLTEGSAALELIQLFRSYEVVMGCGCCGCCFCCGCCCCCGRDCACVCVLLIICVYKFIVMWITQFFASEEQSSQINTNQIL